MNEIRVQIYLKGVNYGTTFKYTDEISKKISPEELTKMAAQSLLNKMKEDGALDETK